MSVSLRVHSVYLCKEIVSHAMLYDFFGACIHQQVRHRPNYYFMLHDNLNLTLFVCFAYYAKTELNFSFLVQTYLETKDEQCRVHHLFTSQDFFFVHVQLQSFVILLVVLCISLALELEYPCVQVQLRAQL